MGWDPSRCFSPPKRQCVEVDANVSTAPAPPTPSTPPTPANSAHEPAPEPTTTPTPQNPQVAATPGEAQEETQKEEEDTTDTDVDTHTVPLSDSATAFLAALGGQPSLFPAAAPPRCPDAGVSAPPPPLHAGTLAEPRVRGPPGLLREEGGVLAYMSNMHR